MLADGLIEESAKRPNPETDDERRRYYRLTEFGLEVARAETERREAVLKVARDKRPLGRRVLTLAKTSEVFACHQQAPLTQSCRTCAS